LDHVGHDQRGWEEHDAEEEEQEEAVALSRGHAGGPEGDRDSHSNEQHPIEHASLLFLLVRVSTRITLTVSLLPGRGFTQIG
jgi:hypothetical protein